jgi:hypothetical protein
LGTNTTQTRAVFEAGVLFRHCAFGVVDYTSELADPFA